MTAQWLPDDFPKTVRGLSDDCLMTVWWLPNYCRMTAPWQSNDNKTSFTALKMDCGKVRTFWEAHKNLTNLLHALYIYLVNVQTTRKVFQILYASPKVWTLCIIKSAPGQNATPPLISSWCYRRQACISYQLKPAKPLKKKYVWFGWATTRAD